LYATAGAEVYTGGFVATLAYQEMASLLRNLGFTFIVWHRLMRAMGRETASEHPFGSRRAMKTVLHRAVADSLAELMGILTVFAVALFETLLAILIDGNLTCAVAKCRGQTVDLQLLLLYGIVLGVRLLALVLERALLVRVIEYYTRTGAARVHVRQLTLRQTDPIPVMEHTSFESERASELGSHSHAPFAGIESIPIPIAGSRNSWSVHPPISVAPEAEPHRAVGNNGSIENLRPLRTSSRSVALRTSLSANSTRISDELTIGFKRLKYEVRKLLGSDNARTTNALVVAVFILVISVSSGIQNGY
jgi:hypothetical protein